MSDNAELRRLAEAATPGPWVKRYNDRVTFPDDSDGTKSIVHCYSGSALDCRANSAFIAAANPARVIALLDRIASADTLLREHVRECVNGGPSTCETCRCSNDWRMRGDANG